MDVAEVGAASSQDVQDRQDLRACRIVNGRTKRMLLGFWCCCLSTSKGRLVLRYLHTNNKPGTRYYTEVSVETHCHPRQESCLGQHSCFLLWTRYEFNPPGTRSRTPGAMHHMPGTVPGSRCSVLLYAMMLCYSQ